MKRKWKRVVDLMKKYTVEILLILIAIQVIIMGLMLAYSLQNRGVYEIFSVQETLEELNWVVVNDNVPGRLPHMEPIIYADNYPREHGYYVLFLAIEQWEPIKPEGRLQLLERSYSMVLFRGDLEEANYPDPADPDKMTIASQKTGFEWNSTNQYVTKYDLGDSPIVTLRLYYYFPLTPEEVRALQETGLEVFE